MKAGSNLICRWLESPPELRGWTGFYSKFLTRQPVNPLLVIAGFMASRESSAAQAGSIFLTISQQKGAENFSAPCHVSSRLSYRVACGCKPNDAAQRLI
jgi:hypothetical protein